MIEVRKIWDKAPHNAFTDLILFADCWYCAFREGRNHVSDDGKLRLIKSVGGKEWTSVALMAWEGGDVRDAKLSITADAHLMLSGAVRFLQPVNGNKRQSVTWLSADGMDWGGPYACPSGLGTWRWSATWHDGIGYSFGYSGKDEGGCLYLTHDGKTWEVVKDDVFPDAQSYPNETSLVFCDNGTAHCLLRRDRDSCSALLGTSHAPYTEWKWQDLGQRIGGPKMIRLGDGRLLAAVRLYDGQVRTSLCWVDAENGTITECLKLPSGGDTSYAGLVEQGDVVWVSYYSSHEAKTAVYLARVNAGSASERNRDR
ncbi:exo-alpha-sialidase [Verrucomicrobiota bacterium]